MGYKEMGSFDSNRPVTFETAQHQRKPWTFYEKVTFQGATRQIIIEDGTIKGFLISGDIVSDNWDGAATLALPDATATLGYALDVSEGEAQFQSIYAQGGTLGTLTVTGWLTTDTNGGFRTAASGQRLQISTSGGNNLTWYNAGNAVEATIVALSGTLSADAGTLLDLSVASLVKLRLSSTALQPFQPIRGINGSASAPSLAFTSDSNTGMYRIDADTLGFAYGGNEGIRLASSGNVIIGGLTARKPLIRNGQGLVSAPQYTFYQDENTGMYSDAADHLKFTAGGTQYLEIDDVANSVTVDNAGFGVGVGFGPTLTAGYFYNTPPTTASAANATWILASGAIYYLTRSTSSARYKSDIQTADWLADTPLRPVKFWSTTDEIYQYGLIAEEVADVLGVEAVELNDEGQVENYDVRAVLAVLVAKVNRLEALTSNCTCGKMRKNPEEL